MKFIVKKSKENVLSLMRRLGYTPAGSRGEELSCFRRLDVGHYPRFHLFVKQEQDKVIFSLHLDQKKPSYAGTTAHKGEYQGEIIQREADRIKKIAAGFEGPKI